MNLQHIKIDTDCIRLDQFLKWASITVTGGEAKIIISEGLIKVNGEVELRRGRQLHSEDVVEVQDLGTFKVVTL